MAQPLQSRWLRMLTSKYPAAVTVASTLIIGGIWALPGATVAAGGAALCTTGAGCSVGIPAVIGGAAAATPGIIKSGAGVVKIMSGLGGVVSGIFGAKNPFDNEAINSVTDFTEATSGFGGEP